MTRPVEIALVGCGAIAQTGYLPALARVPEIRCLWLVDRQRALAETAARRWGIPNAATEFPSVLALVEAVVLAVPNHLHAPMALEALGRGRAVLCEKPLGRTKAEVVRIVEASRRAGAVLVAAMIFRQYPGLQQVRAAFPSEALGGVREIRASYGTPLDWPLSSPDLFDRERAGGGVLLDKGSHLVDSLLWVLSVSSAAVVEYRDDGESGMEAEASARLCFDLPAYGTNASCLLEVSHLRRLDNHIAVRGEKASLVIPLSSAVAPALVENGRPRALPAGAPAPRSGADCFAEQLRAFARRVRGLETNCADGESQVPVLELIESCYAARRPLTFPWHHYAPWDQG